MSLLNVRLAHFDTLVYNDAGSGAKANLCTWKPRHAGWFYLGPAANNGTTGGDKGIVVQATGQKRVLAPITDWETVWNDAGSGKSTDYALWRGLPATEDRADFVVVGGFFVRPRQKPTAADADGMRAVHRDVLVSVNPGREVWNDSGSGAKQDGAVWTISADGFLQAINTGAFIPVQGYNNLPLETYGLNREKIGVLKL